MDFNNFHLERERESKRVNQLKQACAFKTFYFRSMLYLFITEMALYVFYNINNIGYCVKSLTPT